MIHLRGTAAFARRFDTVMKKWLHSSMTMMALLALFALGVPSLAWACPVTGRTGNAATVCDRSPNGGTSVAMSCCARVQAPGTGCMGQCCKSVPQPSGSDQNKDTAAAPSHADTASLLSQLTQAAHTTLVVSTLPTIPLTMEPTHRVDVGDSPSETHLLAQHAPAAFAGRAPPLS